MSLKNSPPDDAFQIRCSKLGHQIHFSYCRRENVGLPCASILTCWHPYFNVTEYLRREMTEEEWKNAMENPVKPKVLTLVELIEQAQRGKTEEKG